MRLPDYKLIGAPRHYVDGYGLRSRCYFQRFRLLHEPARKIRTISLQTSDGAAARRRAVAYVERRIGEIVLATDPHARTFASGVHAALDEYVGDLLALGNTQKHSEMIKRRINRVISEAKFSDYAHIDAVRVTKAISQLNHKGEFNTTATANKYREAMRAWSRWMLKNGRWPTNPLEFMPKFKGDTSVARRRAILTDEQFSELLVATRQGPDHRNLTGEQRYWLYLIASQTGCRAQEMHSLAPKNFHLKNNSPYVEIACTASKRRSTDRIALRPDFAKLVATWLRGKPRNRKLWCDSKGWFNKAADMLRLDLAAAGLKHRVKTPDGPAEIDFHSFRAYRVTKAVMTGANSRVVLAAVRLSCESLLDRYAKIPSSEITACTMAIPLPEACYAESQRSQP